jgi:hypothetical protein
MNKNQGKIAINIDIDIMFRKKYRGEHMKNFKPAAALIQPRSIYSCQHKPNLSHETVPFIRYSSSTRIRIHSRTNEEKKKNKENNTNYFSRSVLE